MVGNASTPPNGTIGYVYIGIVTMLRLCMHVFSLSNQFGQLSFLKTHTDPIIITIKIIVNKIMMHYHTISILEIIPSRYFHLVWLNYPLALLNLSVSLKQNVMQYRGIIDIYTYLINTNNNVIIFVS